jgi:hypothetical protein
VKKAADEGQIHRQTKRELKQQVRQSLFERIILHPPKVAPAARQIHGEAAIGVVKYAYVPFLPGFSNSERGAYRIELGGLPNG